MNNSLDKMNDIIAKANQTMKYDRNTETKNKLQTNKMELVNI